MYICIPCACLSAAHRGEKAAMDSLDQEVELSVSCRESNLASMEL